jgi:hypothetical protein
MVIRDILVPEYDVVRWDGSDDPSGGVLDRAVDIFSGPGKRGVAAKYPDTAQD